MIRQHWYFDMCRRAFVCGVYDYSEPNGEPIEEKYVIDMEEISGLLDLISKEHTWMLSVFKGRDEDDIKLINRLVDIIEKKM